MTGPQGASQPQEHWSLSNTGAFGQGEMHLVGHNVAGRDINISQQARALPQALFQLPADIADFTDREQLFVELRELLTGAGGDEGRAPVVIVLSGLAGVGKSALALHMAHAVTGRYPDAQLYADMGAGSGQPLEPAAVLVRFLRSFGLPKPFPDALDELAAMYRSQLADKRALVVLDNVQDSAQVRPLLPGVASCAVLATSRPPLAGLFGAHGRALGLFTVGDALALMARMIGNGRVDAERTEAAAIVELCGGLPLAVRIAAGRLGVRPDRSLKWLAARLADESQRLGELVAEDRAVRASFAISYDGLAPEEARLFRRLSALPGPDFSLALAVAASQSGTKQVESLLEHLVEIQLLNSAGPDRYRYHDLIRLFARERLDAEDPPDTRQEVANLAQVWLLEQSQVADRQFGPGFALDVSDPAAQAAVQWFLDEFDALTEVLLRAEDDYRRADEQGSAAGACNLGLRLEGRGDVDGAEAAYRRADERGHAEGAFRLGNLLTYRGNQADAEAAWRRADERGHAAAASNLGVLFAERGDLVGAEAAWRRADEQGHAGAAANLGVLLANRGDFDAAEAASRRADERGNADGAAHLGALLDRRGDLVGAEAAYRRADERGSAAGATNLAVLLRRRGDLAGAEGALRRGDRRGGAVAAANLARLLEERGDLAGAEDAARRADERGSADGAHILGVLLNDRGDLAGAEAAYRRASERGVAAGAFNLGVLLHQRGDFDGAAAAFLRAVERAVIEGNTRLAEKAHQAFRATAGRASP